MKRANTPKLADIDLHDLEFNQIALGFCHANYKSSDDADYIWIL